MIGHKLLAALAVGITLLGSAEPSQAQSFASRYGYGYGYGPGLAHRASGYWGSGYGYGYDRPLNSSYAYMYRLPYQASYSNYSGYVTPYNSFPYYSPYSAANPAQYSDPNPAQYQTYWPRVPTYHAPWAGYWVPGVHYGYGPYNYGPVGPVGGPYATGFRGPEMTPPPPAADGGAPCQGCYYW